MERKVIGHMQDRIGPERVGPFGLLQTIADGIKLFMKEDIVPSQADKVVFILAPALTVITALVATTVIPWGDSIELFGRTIGLHITDVNIALLFVLGSTSMGVYGIVLGGWASNSKYPLLGGLRSSAQMISYELAPWFHTEFSSMKFAFYFLGEYANMMVVSGVAITVFLGAWQGPFLPGPVWFLIKLSAFLFFFVWLRATFPRLRYDQLMAFGWKVLLPISLLNLVGTATVLALTGSR